MEGLTATINSGVDIQNYKYKSFEDVENPGIKWSTVGNTALTWEVNNIFDAALDFAMFNRINGSFEWYKRKSDVLLYSMPLPTSLGMLEQPRYISAMVTEGRK